jgi:hypothetical protein
MNHLLYHSNIIVSKKSRFRTFAPLPPSANLHHIEFCIHLHTHEDLPEIKLMQNYGAKTCMDAHARMTYLPGTHNY